MQSTYAKPLDVNRTEYLLLSFEFDQTFSNEHFNFNFSEKYLKNQHVLDIYMLHVFLQELYFIVYMIVADIFTNIIIHLH